MSEGGNIVPGQTTVVVHPLVLLSVVDHYNRACKVCCVDLREFFE